GAMPVILRAQFVALLLFAPFALRDVFALRWVPGALAALLALGVLSTGVAFAIMSVSAGRFGATRASSAAFLIPAEALFLGVLFRGEHVAALSVIGGAVCVAGALIMRSSPAAKKTL